MSQLIKQRVIADDRWTLVREADTLSEVPDGVPVIVPLKLWLERRAALIARGEAGVWLGPDEDPAALAPDVRRLPVIAVHFPVFSDGRGYSTARLLRERYGYEGELRAIGDVQRDQLYYLSQSGFDAFLIREDKDVEDALAGLAVFSDGYQLTHRRTPWFRRRTEAAAPAHRAADAWFSCT